MVGTVTIALVLVTANMKKKRRIIDNNYKRPKKIKTWQIKRKIKIVQILLFWQKSGKRGRGGVAGKGHFIATALFASAAMRRSSISDVALRKLKQLRFKRGWFTKWQLFSARRLPHRQISSLCTLIMVVRYNDKSLLKDTPLLKPKRRKQASTHLLVA